MRGVWDGETSGLQYTQNIPLHPRELSHEERAALVQAATAVLSEAKAKKVLSYSQMFLLHEPVTLGRIARLQSSLQIFWDRGDVLLDAIAAYFGELLTFSLACTHVCFCFFFFHCNCCSVCFLLCSSFVWADFSPFVNLGYLYGGTTVAGLIADQS